MTKEAKDFLKNALKNLRKQLKQILISSKIKNKAEQAYKLLSDTMQTFTEKNDKLSSTQAFQFCEMKMKSIEAEYPQLGKTISMKHF